MSLFSALGLQPPPRRAAKGEIGHIAPPGSRAQGPAGRDPNGRRTTEDEHVLPNQKLRALTRDPATGVSDYTEAHYKADATVRTEYETSLDKTHGNRGGPTADNPSGARLKAMSQANVPGRGINYREEVFDDSVENMKRAVRATGSRVTEAQIGEAALAQDGNLFGLQRMSGTLAKLGAGPDDVDRAVSTLDFGEEEGKALRQKVEADRKRARTVLVQAQAVSEALEKRIAATSGDVKKGHEASRATVTKKIEEATAAIEQADEDLEAIGNPHTAASDLATIRARRGAGPAMKPTTEVAQAGELLGGRKLNRDQTRTTSAFDGESATVDQTRSQRSVGAKGVTTTQSQSSTRSNTLMTSTRTQSTTTQTSWTGTRSTEETTSHQVTMNDGRTASTESTRSQQVGPGGASRGRTDKTTNLDGSSTTTTRKQEVSRGDGKVTATTSAGSTTTSAKGTEHAREGSASAGFAAGKDGIGAHGGIEGGRKVTSKGGRQAGVVGGLHANVMCKVSEGKGDPPTYEVALTVSFGGSVGASGGAGKQEGSKRSADVQVQASMEKSMTVTHVFGADELAGYVQSLEAASKGSKVAATYNEFAVIAAGVQANDWGVARDVWKGLSADAAKALRRAGDSVEFAETTTKGVGANVQVQGVGGGASVTRTDASSRKVTRNQKGGLDAEGKGSHTEERKLSGSLDVGVAGVAVGSTRVHQTRFGFAIEIDPADDPKGTVLAALGACRAKADYLAFLKKHPKARMVSQTDGRSDAEATDVGLSLGGKKVLTFGTSQGVDEDTKTDASGKVLARRVAGKAGAGGKLGPMADSMSEEAVSEVDEDGEASLTMTRTEDSNHGDRSRDKRIKKLAQKLQGKGPAAGPLAALAGNDDEDDSATRDVSGIKLSNADLKKLGGVACRSMGAWMGVPRRHQEIADWKKAGQAIAVAKGKPSVVAEELARFVGGDRVERMKTLENFIRGGYKQTTGKAFEFPDSLRDLQADFDLVTDDKLADRMNAYANKNGDPAAAKECQRLLDIAEKVHARLKVCDDFRNQATKMEMLKDLMDNRDMLSRGVKGYGGNLKADSDPKVLKEQADRLYEICLKYWAEENRLAQRMDDQDADTVSERADGQKLLRQMENLHDRWEGDHARLLQAYGRIGATVPPYPPTQPNATYITTYTKKFRAG